MSSDLASPTATTGPDEALRSAFRQAFDLSPDFDVSGLSYQGVRQWDSIGHMQLVTEIEERFGVMLEPDGIVDLSSYAEARSILSRYGVAFPA